MADRSRLDGGPGPCTAGAPTVAICADPFACRNPSLHARIGIARVDISPAADAPINNWGAAPRRRASGRLSELAATVLTVGRVDSRSDHASTLVLVALDLGWWRTDEAADTLRSEIARSAGVGPDRVLVSLSHTHAGPAIDPAAVELTARADVAAYLQHIAATIGSAVIDAIRSAQPALLEWGRGSCDLARVRDQWLTDEQRYVCGYDAAGRPDSTLVVGRVVADRPDADGKRLLAVVAHYACHPTTLGPDNTKISADFVAEARHLVEDHYHVPMVFLQGASGDLAPRRQYETEAAVVRANGDQLGFAILSALAGMLPTGKRLVNARTVESGAPLGTWRLDDDRPSEQLLIRDCQVDLPPNDLAGQWGNEDRLSEAARAERQRRAELVEGVSGTGRRRMPLSAWRLGDIAFLAVAGEPYSRLQCNLRESRADPVLVLNLTGGAHHGYLPPSESYHRSLYQAWQTPAGQGSLELVESAALRLIGELFSRPESVDE